jgi:gamma-carbonic anhydrase
MATIIALAGKAPRIAPGVFIAPNATIIGDVVIDEGASVWFGCVLRADIGSIRIGKRSNIQDLTCIHMTDGISNTEVGDDVTVGHRVVLHGCKVGHRALIGMGSVLLDNVEIGEESLVAAGSLVSPRTVVPARSLLRGSPGKVVRPVTDEERLMGQVGAAHYVENAKRYMEALEASRA